MYSKRSNNDDDVDTLEVKVLGNQQPRITGMMAFMIRSPCKDVKHGAESPSDCDTDSDFLRELAGRAPPSLNRGLWTFVPPDTLISGAFEPIGEIPR